jgi:hypothetical protein
MRDYIAAIGWVLLLFFWALGSGRAQGAEKYYLLDASRVSMEFYEVKNNRDGYLLINDRDSDKYGESNEHWTYGAALDLDFDILRYGPYALYWQNNVHMDATNVAVRHVGWEYELGARLGKHFDLFWYHHSRHIMDTDREGPFPLTNRYGVRFIFVETGRK